ncbi:MAG: phage tail tape measure protein, partial [Bradyrhizobium sp.]|nr:phage tail tape measure protein [Bradyrhizobium sp.]
SNFQARDFSIGLSKAAAMGATFKQSLDDVLITMGLLRNRNIDASSSATAFREATRRLGADQRSQKAVIGAGVKLFDKYSGKMRSIVDIMSDFAKATDDMTEKERNRRVARAFGARGLLAFNAIQTASYTAMKNGTQVTYQGAAAISEMRKQMKSATGTAAEFRKKLLDTFEGQKTLLKGTVQTLGVVFGEPFAAVFKPLVSVIVNALNAVIRAFQAVPEPVKVAFAGFVSMAGVVIALGGAAIFAKGAFALLGMAGAALGISLGG